MSVKRRRLVVVLASVAALTAPIAAVGVGAATHPRLYQKLTQGERRHVESVSRHTFARVGTGGSAENVLGSIHDRKLTAGGKPDVVFIDAEFCPYCAAERWSLVVALDRFGTVRGLRTMLSSATDVDPNTPTVSFRYAHYTSSRVAFTPIVNEKRNHERLEKVPHRLGRLWVKHSRFHERGYPFVYIAGRFLSNTAPFDPRVLAGHSRAEIAAALNHPASPIAKAVDGVANRYTAAICASTDDHPERVCQAAPIPRLERSLR